MVWYGTVPYPTTMASKTGVIVLFALVFGLRRWFQGVKDIYFTGKVRLYNNVLSFGASAYAFAFVRMEWNGIILQFFKLPSSGLVLTRPTAEAQMMKSTSLLPLLILRSGQKINLYYVYPLQRISKVFYCSNAPVLKKRNPRGHEIRGENVPSDFFFFHAFFPHFGYAERIPFPIFETIESLSFEKANCAAKESISAFKKCFGPTMAAFFRAAPRCATAAN